MPDGPDRDDDALFGRARDGVGVLTPDWRIRYANASLLEILDLLNTGSGAGGDRLWDALPHWADSDEAADLRRAMETRAPVCFRVDRARGGGFVWEVTAEPAGAQDLRVRLRNVTAQAEAESRAARAALGEREVRLGEIVAGAPVALALLDTPGFTVLEANEAYVRLLDPPWTTPAAVVGHPLSEVIPDFQSSGVGALLERVRDTGQPYENPELAYHGFRRGPAWFRIVMQPLAPDARGLPAHVLLMVVEITDLVNARQAVEAERRAIFEVVDTLPVGVVVAAAPSGRTLFVNAAAAAMAGQEPEELTLRLGEYAVHWRLRRPDGEPFPEAELPLVRALRGEPSREVELVLHPPGGEPRTVFASGAPLRGGSGQVERGVVTFYDVTERLQLERALVERTTEAEHAAANAALRAEESRALRDMGRTLVSSLDMDDVLRLATQHAMELLGARGGFVALPEPDGAHLRLSPGLGTMLGLDGVMLPMAGSVTALTLREGARYYNDMDLLPTTSEIRPLVQQAGLRNALLVPMRAFGEALGVLAVVDRAGGFGPDDVRLLEAFADSAALGVHNARLYASERRRAEVNRALLAAAEALASTLDPSEVMARIVHLAGELTSAEGAALTMLAGEDGSEITMPVATGLLAPLRGHGGPLAGSLTEEVTRRDQPLVISAGDGESHASLAWLRRIGVEHYAVVPLRAGDDPVGALGVVRSSRQTRFSDEDLRILSLLGSQAALAVRNARLYEGAQSASRAKSDFLAMMSHELRTPLNALEGYASLMEEGIYGPVTEPQARALTRMRAARRHLVSLIDQVLDVARVEAGTKRVALEPVSLPLLAREVVEALRGAADARGLAVEFAGAAMPPVRTDPGLVRQILTNLLGNAVKFTERGGIRVRVGAEGGSAFVDVADTGPGIAPELQERVFEPFYQVDPSTTRREGGVGLGLALSREFARLMGGDLSVRSEPGAGSTFTLTLPMAPPAPDP